MLRRASSARLALLLPSLAAGGVARSMLHLAGAFHDAGHPVDLVLCEAAGPYLDAVPPGVRIVPLHAEGGLAARLRLARLDPRSVAALARPVLFAWRPAPVQPYVADLARYLHRVQPAALLAAKTPTNLLALWARRLSGAATRVVAAEHTQLSQSIARSRRWRWRYIAPLVARMYPYADALAAVSGGVADDLARTARIARESISTIYNPVVTPALAGRVADPPPHPWFEATSGPPVVVAAGRLVPQKNFPLLLNAFARFRARRPARLVILGEGRERPRLEALAKALGVADDVALPGHVANPYAAFARAALFVLSSDWEGLPTVLVEALACGCPVASTNCPSGPAEILQGGRYGELVPVGDENALVAAMARTLDAPPAADLLRRRGAEFSVERSAARYLEVLLPQQARVSATA
jgi:glycosyltransferase involved in cell wall biosynthesis